MRKLGLACTLGIREGFFCHDVSARSQGLAVVASCAMKSGTKAPNKAAGGNAGERRSSACSNRGLWAALPGMPQLWRSKRTYMSRRRFTGVNRDNREHCVSLFAPLPPVTSPGLDLFSCIGGAGRRPETSNQPLEPMTRSAVMLLFQVERLLRAPRHCSACRYVSAR